MELKTLGTFRVPSGKLFVTDIVSSPPTSHDLITFSDVVPVKTNSEWTAVFERLNDAPFALTVVRTDRQRKELASLQKSGSIGSDSVIVGIFDVDGYTSSFEAKGDKWLKYFFDRVTGLTSFGAFCENGLGAGFFDVYVAKEGKGEVTQVTIALQDNDDDDDDRDEKNGEGEPGMAQDKRLGKPGRCHGLTKKGTRCKNKTSGEFCSIHSAH